MEIINSKLQPIKVQNYEDAKVNIDPYILWLFK